MIKFFQRFLADEDGATAIEYGLIAALLSVAIIGGVSSLGGTLSTKFSEVDTAVSNANAGN